MFGSEKAFDVEHALIIFAQNYVQLPAAAIYDDESLKPLLSRIKDCHIYIIGLLPKTDFEGASQKGNEMLCHIRLAGELYDVPFELPNDWFVREEAGKWYISDGKGGRFFPSNAEIIAKFQHLAGVPDFDILYIGQAYGKSGERNALDRLKKHETLQKISLQGVPSGYNLNILMIKINDGNRTTTLFNPFAKDKTNSDQRITNGVNKLCDTDDKERTTLYEASLIRYFEPKFNKEFKASFPSTNLKVLRDCYDKDFSAVVAEINFDDLPYNLRSSVQNSQSTVTAMHNLHLEENRRVFFGLR